MPKESPGYVKNVDALIEETHPSEVAAFYGYPWLPASGNEVRMECPVADCEPSSYGKLAVNVADPANKIHCHSCGVRGNLLVLMWIMKHQRPPEGGRLRGTEFKEMVGDLQTIRGGQFSAEPVARSGVEETTVHMAVEQPQPNMPLKDSENERTRELVDLHLKGTVEPAEMTPAAAKYFRQRPFLTPEMCAKWNIAYLASNVKSTLRDRVVYAIHSVAGDQLAWVGRDPDFESKQIRWTKTQTGSEPIKHRFPSQKYFRRGLELYGQQSHRLREAGYRDAIAEIGILVVEGMNDVVRLDALETPAVAVMSNRITRHQVEKIVRWTRQLAGGKVSLMFDNDDAGQDGAKQAVWELSQHVAVQAAWSAEMFDGQFAGREPESLSPEEWQTVRDSLRSRWNSA
jgi:5S rRNA maturation endonuclease (ribonuclease M5)